MLLAILTLLTGLMISGVAIYYSVAGLTSIFAAAVVPIIIMGTSLEVAKLVTTIWLKQNWKVAPRLLKAYLLIAVTILMVITSMGIFGYLSKAHSDQSLISGDVQAKVAVYDEKIKTAQDNIAANRQALQQMDAQVDQLLGRTTDDKGANRAVQVRRQQRAERERLQQEIAADQELIAKTNEEAAPIRAEIRKVEAEVGPIKYIAALIYGDQASATMLEDAVRWVIIMIVIVFDPLAITLLLASQYSFQRLREDKETQSENKFVETFLESRGTVDPDINLEFDEPKERVPDESFKEAAANIISSIREQMPAPESVVEPDQDIREYLADLEERTAEDNKVVDPELEASRTRIIHTKDGMIIEDAAGKQEIKTPEIVEIDRDYISVDGQIFNRKAYDGARIPPTYVQNEEQAESNKWSNVLGTITEDRYLEAAQRKQKKASE